MRSLTNIYDILFIAYGSVINTVGILLCHLLYFVSPDHYIALSPYLCTIFGIQLIKALTDIRLSYKFKFCEVTRFNNWCYLFICISYMVFYYLSLPEIYTVITQTTLAVIGLISFVYLYMNKHPNCHISLWVKAKKRGVVIFGSFVKLFVGNGFDCGRALEELKKQRYGKHLRDEKLR